MIFSKLYYTYKEYRDLETRSVRGSKPYNQWRYYVLKRDRHRCVKCGSRRNLDVHHLEMYSDKIEERLRRDNGVTLCRSCHEKEHPWMGKPAAPKVVLRKATRSADGVKPVGADKPGAPEKGETATF